MDASVLDAEALSASMVQLTAQFDEHWFISACEASVFTLQSLPVLQPFGLQ